MRYLVMLASWLLISAVIIVPAAAVEPDEVMADPRLEARARNLSSELRCLVCQNQSIDDSNAPLARDLRLIVRERLKAGDSDERIMGYVVARYGTFVLLRPPVERSTLLLWATPILLLAFAGLLLARKWRTPAATEVPLVPLSADEVIRLERLTKS